MSITAAAALDGESIYCDFVVRQFTTMSKRAGAIKRLRSVRGNFNVPGYPILIFEEAWPLSAWTATFSIIQWILKTCWKTC